MKILIICFCETNLSDLQNTYKTVLSGNQVTCLGDFSAFGQLGEAPGYLFLHIFSCWALFWQNFSWVMEIVFIGAFSQKFVYAYFAQHLVTLLAIHSLHCRHGIIVQLWKLETF